MVDHWDVSQRRSGVAATMPGMRQALLTVAVAAWLANSARALGPHELLVVANANSTSSVTLARDYMRLRQVPETNLVLVALPPATWAPPHDITTNEFTALIWKPAQRAIRERGLGDHILAWVYSIDMPIRIKTDPPVSITGLTFVRNRLPPKNDIVQGLYASVLFAGPDSPDVRGASSQSLDNQSAWLGPDMPIPAMLLGYDGPHGNTLAEIEACLRRGRSADSSMPDGIVYLITNSDIRTQCRLWQFPAVVRELHALGVTATITNALPVGGPPIAGVLHGLADIDLRGERTFVPGCMAEHLTSFGAVFEIGQTKLTAWIKTGATASAGTITEPYAIWAKFPHARYFVHAASGCTIMESFYLSVRCPLQFLPVGEPLAAPWRPTARVSLSGLPDGPLREPVTVTATVQSDARYLFNRFLFLLDGRTLQPIGISERVTLSPAGLTPGRHTLRAVAYAVGAIRHQAFAESDFQVETQP